jgi:saccharopine dehydrogenase-like NADP-dependent oxidoreductase
MANLCVLGCGMVGSAIVKDLAAQHQVLATDLRACALEAVADLRNVRVQALDVNDSKALLAAIAPCDLVINAVPGFLGFATLQQVIGAAKNVVDIAFYPEDALALDAMAREHNVTAIVDMGVAPGMSNLILGFHDARLQVEQFKCYVGGLPKVRTWPFSYKAPFSPVDVIEEYTRPARLKEFGHIVQKPALSDREFMEFAQVGTLEAFNTDGLRSLLTTMNHIPNLLEKTLRYPGHVELIQALIHSGFFSQTELDINGQKVIPRELTSHLLQQQWQLHPGEREFTVMRIIITGTLKDEPRGTKHNVQYDLFDEYDAATQISSMARTTGYACTAAANLVLSGQYNHHGITPPEQLGKHSACFDSIMDYLQQRSIHYRKTEE